MSYWELYFILKLDHFRGFSLGFSFVIVILLIVITIIYCVCKYDDPPANDEVIKSWGNVCKNCLKTLLPLFVFLMICRVFLPTTKQMAAILVIPQIANNEKVKKIPNQILDLANEWMEELKPRRKN